MVISFLGMRTAIYIPRPDLNTLHRVVEFSERDQDQVGVEQELAIYSRLDLKDLYFFR